MAAWCQQNVQFHVAPPIKQPNNCCQYTTSEAINATIKKNTSLIQKDMLHEHNGCAREQRIWRYIKAINHNNNKADVRKCHSWK